MTIRHCAALLIAILALSLFSGCSIHTAVQTADVLEDAVEYHAESVEESIEIAHTGNANLDFESLIGAEEATSIALAHAGLTHDEISLLQVEYDPDNHIPQYEVNFMSENQEYEYEIHAQMGAILSHDLEWELGTR